MPRLRARAAAGLADAAWPARIADCSLRRCLGCMPRCLHPCQARAPLKEVSTVRLQLAPLLLALLGRCRPAGRAALWERVCTRSLAGGSVG